MKTLKKMTAAQKRVAIAKDVIAGLNDESLIAETGVYLHLIPKTGLVGALSSPRKRFDVILCKNVKACEVCGLGAIFVSAVKRFDEITVAGIGRVDQNYVFPPGKEGDKLDVWAGEYLSKFFLVDQILLIESYFETKWQKTIVNSTDRMIAIMKNIIKNRGTFKP